MAAVAIAMMDHLPPNSLGLFFNLYSTVSTSTFLIYAGWAVILAIKDRRRSRDVLHYVGVGLLVAELMVTVLWSVAFRM
jgi:hypothetical protein